MDLDALCEHARDHHRNLVAEAARRQLRPRPASTTIPWRRQVALALRRWADRLEPREDRAEIGVVRALAHHEIDVDQAIVLLDRLAAG